MSRFSFLALMLAGSVIFSACGRAPTPTSAYLYTAPVHQLQQPPLPTQNMVVKFKTNVNATDIDLFHRQYRSQTAQHLSGIHRHLLTFPQGQPNSTHIQHILHDVRVEHIEINGQIRYNPLAFGLRSR